MDILQLRYFYDSANFLSIAKTAEKYKVPPTSVSASIRRLEKELGTKLFDRTPNRIILNANGRIMRDSLKVIFDEMDRMLQAVSSVADDSKEVTILAKSVRSLMTEQIIQFKEKFSHTRFKLTADYGEKDPRGYDIIIDTENDAYVGYSSVPLGKQYIYLYVPQSSHLLGRSFKLKELSQMPFVLMCQERNHGKIFADACKKAGFSPNVLAQVNDSACFKKIISSGIAIGVTGEFASSAEMGTRLMPLEVSDFNPCQTICMYYKKENLYGNTARFASFIEDNVAKGNLSGLKK